VRNDEIEVVSGAPIGQLPRHFRGGIYILQSATDLRYYRIGESKNLLGRQGTHGGSPPKTKWAKAPNWTEVFRPWQFLWVASIPTATHLALKMCEHQLHAAFAHEYEFVDESGFEASPDHASKLIEFANGQLQAFRRICERQRCEKFDKEAYWRSTWPD
jgi:hypothetical protein